MSKGTTLRLIPALLAVAFSGSASASGFQLLEQNASGIGNAYAGSAAVAENASTILFNPAGMTQLQAREVSVGVSAISTSFKFSNDGASSVGSFATAGNGGDGGGWGFVPNGYVSWALSKDLYLGLGVGAPFGLKVEYDKSWIGAAQSTSFDIKTYNLNPSIAYRVNDTVSVGFGLNWQRIEAEYLRQAGTTAGTSLVQVKMKLDDDSWGWNAGLLFKLSPATKIGVSYRSEVKYKTKGNVALSSDGSALGNATLAGLVGAGRASDVKAKIDVPDTVVLSGTHQLNDRWELLGDVSWTGWSSIPKVDIFRTSGVLNGQIAQTLDTRFRDTWRFAVGANYRIDDAWKLKLGVAYDQTPVPNAAHRLTSLPDNDRTWLSVGAQWRPNKTSTLDMGLTYLYVKDPKISNDQRADVRGLVSGSYDASIWILGAQYSMAF